MEIIFDPKKLKIVSIDQVKPNTWNPKDRDTKEYQNIRRSIELKGLRLPVIVREVDNDSYEIIDGEQRYTACKELNFKQVLIYNEGSMGDKQARELTIFYQQQVPFNEIELLDLIKEIASFDGKYELPYTEEEIQEKLKMLEFDWENYQSEIKDYNKEDKKIICPNCGHEFSK